MTAVARIQVNGWPLLFADLLVSGPTTRGSQLSLPSVDVIHHSSVDRGAKGLHQKIAIVADNIVIGWAGNHSAASDVIGELKDRCEQESFSSRQVEEFLRRRRKSVWKDIGLVGFVLDNDANNLSTFGCACKTIQSSSFGEIGLLGSGSSLMEQYFEQDSNVPNCLEDPENLAIRSVAYGMAAAANFLTMEQFACESLDSLFGGGYEIATQSYEKFVKLTGVLYAFWRATLDSDQTLVRLKSYPFLLMRYEYYSDLLVIRSIALNEIDGTASTHEAIFPIPPVYRYLSAEEKARPSVPQLKSNWLCNYVQIFSKPGKMDILTLASYTPDQGRLQFEERDGRLVGMTISGSLYDEIFLSIETRYTRREQL